MSESAAVGVEDFVDVAADPDISEVDESWLADSLSAAAAGPELAGLLASVDRSGLDAAGLLVLARARSRQLAYEQAQLLADLYRVARTVPHQGAQPGRRDLPGKYPWAEVECAFALRWTTVKAGAELELADELIDRLPQVYAALAAGEIDRPRAVVFVNALAGVEDGVAGRIADRVIGVAPRLTTGQLAARLRRLVLAACPELATQRAREEVITTWPSWRGMSWRRIGWRRRWSG